MIRIRIECRECGKQNPNVQLATFGYKSFRCLHCGKLLKVDASADAIVHQRVKA